MKNIKNTLRNILCIFSVFIFLLVTFLFIFSWIKSFTPAFNSNFDNSKDINYQSIFQSLSYTFFEATVSTFISLVIGIPAAFFISKRNFFLRKIYISFSAIPLCIPAIIVALGYISSFGISGVLNDIVKGIFNLREAPFKFLYSFWGIVICQGFYNFPLIMITTANTWSHLSSDEEDIARLLRASKFTIFRKITFYKLQHSIFSSSIPVFIFCYFSFMIVQLFGSMDGTTLEVSIYHAARSSINFKRAGILSLIETISAIAILFLYSLTEKKSNLQKGTLPSRSCSRTKITIKDLPLFIPFIIITIIFFILPIFCIIENSFSSSKGFSQGLTLSTWKRFLSYKGLWTSLLNTLKSSILTGFISVICGGVFSFLNFFIHRKNKNNFLSAVISSIPLLPMAVSSVVLSIGMGYLFKRPGLIHLCITQSALFWPFSFKIIFSALKKIPDSVIDSGLLLSKTKTDVIFEIILPYIKNAILSSLGLTFAMSAGDATIPLVLGMHNYNTLSLFTYRLAGSYRINEACCGGLLLGIICVGAFLLTQPKEISIKEKKLK